MMTTAEIKAQRAKEWHPCTRCDWKDGACVRCSRPKGAPKNWRPDAPVASREEPVPSASSAPATDDHGINLGADLEAMMAAEFKAMGKPIPVPASAKDTPAPSPRAVVEAPAVAALSPFAPAPAPMGFPATRSVAPAASIAAILPAHSPLGGSAAERYMKCSASVELSRTLRIEDADHITQEEWTAEGTLAHALLEHCLKNDVADAILFIGGEGEWEAVTDGIALAVQEALDYVRSRPGRMMVEHKFHRPELHELYFGQADIVLYGVQADFLEIIDYKNGAGVIVEVEHNEQLMYYANGVLHSPDFEGGPDSMPVRLTIVQPNAWHSGGKIRSWDTTAGELRAWLHEHLVPAMAATMSQDGWFFDMGKHCQFCPAKLACPAFANVARKALSGARLTFEEVQQLKSYVTTWMKEAYARLMGGENPEAVGAKLVPGRAYREWKADAEPELVASLGEKAYVRKVISPAQAEELPGGKDIVARWAFTPEAAPSVGSLSDKRTAKPFSMADRANKVLDVRAA